MCNSGELTGAEVGAGAKLGLKVSIIFCILRAPYPYSGFLPSSPRWSEVSAINSRNSAGVISLLNYFAIAAAAVT